VVVAAVVGPLAAPVRLVGRELEEEDDAVDGVELGEGVGVEREELLELDALDAQVLEEVGEDALAET